MSHALAEQRFASYEDVKKWLDEPFAVKGEDFTVVVFTNCPKDGENVQQATEDTLNKTLFYHSSEFNVFFKKNNPHFVLIHLVWKNRLRFVIQFHLINLACWPTVRQPGPPRHRPLATVSGSDSSLFTPVREAPTASERLSQSPAHYPSVPNVSRLITV